jgi:TetR/AcrR family tetracycline transcriptional repressor
VPVIDRAEVIVKAIEIIDADGLDALSIRRLGKELGVNGASLYHHFQDKEEILQGVRLLVLQEARVLPPTAKGATWHDYVTRSVARYRAALLRHPNTAPLMAPEIMRPVGLGHRERLVAKMIEEGIPVRYCYPIIDSAETLAFGSALLNPRQLSPRDRFAGRSKDGLPHLDRAIRSTSRSAERLFTLELQALLTGWATTIERDSAKN